MKLRSGWPLALFVVLIVAVPIFEVYVLVQFFLIPVTRPFARKVVAFFVARRLSRAGLVPAAYAPHARGTVVEGEVVPDDSHTVTVSPDQIESGRP